MMSITFDIFINLFAYFHILLEAFYGKKEDKDCVLLQNRLHMFIGLVQ